MIITAQLNGVTVKKDIPTRWQELTFGQYLDLFDTIKAQPIDPTKVLSILIGIDEATLMNVKIKNLDAVLSALSFMSLTPMDTYIPKTILGYPIPKDLNFETNGQFRDAQTVCESLPRPTKPDEVPVWTREDMAKYAEIVSIFAWGGQYHDSTEEDKQAFAAKFLKAPCEEVLAIGNFTVLKLIGLRLNIRPDSPNRNTSRRNWRRALRIWVLNTAFSLRYSRLKKKLGLTGTSF